jgi:hypothetical protein
VAGPVERLKKSFKDSLDRRYADHDQIDALRTELESVSRTVDTLSGDLRGFVEEVGDVVERLKAIETITADLNRRLEEVILATSPSVDFTRVALPALEVRLADAHRLATESALAIEELLQQEILIRRDLNALLALG